MPHLFLQICGVWKNLPKAHVRLLQGEQMQVSMATAGGRREEVQGKIIKHRALFAGLCVCLSVCVLVCARSLKVDG